MRAYQTQYSLETIQSFKERATLNKKTSDKYRMVNTEELLSVAERVLGEHGLEYTRHIGGPSKGFKGTKHIVQYTIDNHELHVLGDSLKPRLTFLNSYNGEAALNIRVGLFRLVCSNGLIVGQSFYHDRLVHVKGITIEQKLMVLAQKLHEAIAFIKYQASDLIASNMSQELSETQELSILNSLKNNNIISNRIFDRVVSLRTQGIQYRFLRAEDSQRNVWTLYNTINETIRQYSRSELSNTLKNIKLMDTVIEYSKAA